MVVSPEPSPAIGRRAVTAHPRPNHDPTGAATGPSPPVTAALPGKADQQTIRDHNLSLVLRLLIREGALSRASIAERTGLTKATASTLVSELATLGLVCEGGEQAAGRPGRPPTPVEVADRRVALGLEIGVGRIAVCSVGLTGQVQDRRVERWDCPGTAPGEVLGRLTAMAQAALAEAGSRGQLPVGAGLAVPGLIDPESGTVVFASHLGWEDLAIGRPLTDALGCSVYVENEANLSARAELAYGWGARWTDFIFVSAGVGIGAGVVTGGQLFRGAHGFGGELGHMVLDPEGPACPCGNRGCLELWVGKDHLPPALLARGEQDWPLSIARMAKSGNRDVTSALSDLAKKLSVGLVSAVNLFDPQAVVLGGYLAPLAPWMAGIIHGHLNSGVLGSRWANYQVVPSRLGAEARVLGGAASWIERVISNPLIVQS